jgi:colanic acid/amylovoran biosynthesis glycosyltransferase
MRRPAERRVMAAASPDLDAERPLRLAYVTSRFPFGLGETFLLPEVRALERRVGSLAVVPMRPVGGVVHADAAAVVGCTLREGLLSPRVVLDAAVELGRNPGDAALAVHELAGSRSPRVLAKNALVTAKALWLARLLRRLRVDHVHAHWGGASSTLAMLSAEAAGVPWSLTLHRWDIAEDNLLDRKLASAAFVRTISEHGAELVQERVPGARVDVIHMGVELAPDGREHIDRSNGRAARFRLLAVGHLIPMKDHELLLESLGNLRVHGSSGPPVTLDVAGEGPLRGRLEQQARRLGLGGSVRFLGLVEHTELLRRMRAREWDALVHPSAGGDDDAEGIPVALMEAMGAGLPVVACRSGGVAELVRPGAGLLVDKRDPRQLADAIDELRRNPERARRLAAGGRERVLAEFEAGRVADELVRRFRASARGGGAAPA